MEVAQLQFLEEAHLKEGAVEVVVDVESLHRDHQDHLDLMDNQDLTDSRAAQEKMDSQAHKDQAQPQEILVPLNVQPAHQDHQEIQDPKDHPEMQALQDKMFKEEDQDQQAHPDQQDHPDKQADQETTGNQELLDKLKTDHLAKDHPDQLDPQEASDPQDQEETMANPEIQAGKDHPVTAALQVAQEMLVETANQDRKVKMEAKESVITVHHLAQPLDIKIQPILHGIPDFSIEFMAFFCIPLLFFKNVYFIEIT